MKYLEDTLAEQCLSKTLYPNTKIIVRRKKVEGTLMTYTNELEVEIDFSDVDPTLLETNEKIVEIDQSILNSNSNLESSTPSRESNEKDTAPRLFKK
jgi:hypothetical protein